jgi:hypothetical protein
MSTTNTSTTTHVIIKQEQTLPGLFIYILELLSWDIRRLPGGVLCIDLREQHLYQYRSPRVRRMCRHHLMQRRMPCSLLLRGHQQTPVHRLRYVLQTTRFYPLVGQGKEGTAGTHPEIPRVHLQRIRHVLADTHELAQDERRMLRALLRDHELHRCSVHPIPEGRDHAEISGAQQRVEFVLSERLVAIWRGVSW